MLNFNRKSGEITFHADLNTAGIKLRDKRFGVSYIPCGSKNREADLKNQENKFIQPERVFFRVDVSPSK